MSPASQTDDNLELMGRFIGWGNPQKTLWFVGLEEAKTFKQPYLETVRDRERASTSSFSASDGGQLYWQTPEMMRHEGTGITDRLDRAEGWLVGELRGQPELTAIERWQISFHCNVYPLGYQRGKGFPSEEYSGLFGVSSSQDAKFKAVVARRCSRMLELLNHARPKAIVCFGRSYSADFTAALKLTNADQQRIPGITVFASSHTIIAPHWSWGWHFSRTKRGVLDLLREWEVAL